MLVLCPNHHAMFDLGIPTFETSGNIIICGELLSLTYKHRINPANMTYHNSQISKARAP